ncbi:hypothetical protein [Arcanobacterium buesumense]|uniref:Uncharacterized protein n=1 Tax=Arcanobacterium buesumense TaxID=2722751 RepID=A0A6H2EKQ9_9ACTO|nr:hypothetical protein [Arcanobacterium buesumense]QJC21509.1 hypothetical protein HC352_02595 [Arcanobacterium buesumense]
MPHKTTIRIGSIIVLLFTLFTGLSPAYAQADTVAPSETLTVEEYEAYLSQNSPETLAEFRALTNQQQDLFVRALQDPALYTDAATDLPGVTTGLTRFELPTISAPDNRLVSASDMLANGPTYVTNASTIDKNVWSTRWVKIFGVKVIEFRMELGYQVRYGKVSKINYSNAYTSRNWNPAVHTSLLQKSAWVSAGGRSAKMNARFSYNIGPLKGLSWQMLVLRGDMTAYPSGGVSTYWVGQ